MDNVRTGRLIAGLRKQKGWTQQELADRMNLSNKTISKWESGAGSPDISNLPVLAEVLGVTVDELLRGEVSDAADAKEAPIESGTDSASARKVGRAIVVFAACVGAVLGILAYNFGWLG